MPQFFARKGFRLHGEWVERGQTIDLTGYDSRSIARLMDQDLVEVVPGGDDGSAFSVTRKAFTQIASEQLGFWVPFTISTFVDVPVSLGDVIEANFEIYVGLGTGPEPHDTEAWTDLALLDNNGSATTRFSGANQGFSTSRIRSGESEARIVLNGFKKIQANEIRTGDVCRVVLMTNVRNGGSRSFGAPPNTRCFGTVRNYGPTLQVTEVG